MKKIFLISRLLIASLLCVWTPLGAALRTPEQAQQIAANYLSKRALRRALPAQNSLKTVPISFSQTQSEKTTLYAVNFTDQNSFILVSGDDRFVPVLGYCTNTTFDELSIPENMRAWLQGYVDEINCLNTVLPATGNTTIRQSDTTTQQLSPITPLISTTWNQSAPYNNLCPLDNSNTRTVTGCVATAMAQVINFHMQRFNAPTHTQDAIEAYTTGSSITVDAIPANTPLPDKTLLLNNYTASATNAQKEAVAKLMLYCGASVKMNYTASSSSAHVPDVPWALVKNFGFDQTAQYVLRNNFTYAQWMDTIYHELENNRPVIFNGHSSGGGHAFIVDGCDDSGLFHINWGWGGSSNGYFALSALNPDDSNQIGASTSSDGYNMSHGIVIGAQIGKSQTPVIPPVCLTMNLKYVEDRSVTFSVYNYTGETHSFEFGLGAIDQNGQITQIGSVSTANNLKNIYGWGSKSVTVPINILYSNTTKKIVPVSRVKGTTTWYTSGNTNRNYVLADYSLIGIPSLTLHPAPLLQGGGITVNTGLYVNEKQTVKMTITNNGDEIYGTLYLFADYTTDAAQSNSNYVSNIGITALENSTQTITFDWTPTLTGTYELSVCANEDGKNVISSASVIVKSDPNLADKSVAVTALSLAGLDKDSYQFDEQTGKRSVDIYADTLKGTISITNLTNQNIASFTLKVQYELYDETTGQATTKSTSTYNLGTLYAGKERKLSVNKKLDFNKTYRIRLIRTAPSPTKDLDARYVLHLYAPKKSLQHHDISISNIPHQQYNASPITPPVTIKDGNTVITDLCNITYTDNTNAGQASVIINAKENAKSYSGTTGTTFTILPAPLTAAAKDTAITYGEPAPDFSVIYTGWKGNDNESLLAGELSFSCNYNAGDNAGTYTITPYGVTADNYNISFRSATLTVNPAPNPPTGIKPVAEEEINKCQNRIILRGGQLFILHQGTIYTTTGQRVH